MRVISLIFQLFAHWQFWVASGFLIALFALISQITALDKKPAAVYVRLPSSAPAVKAQKPAKAEKAEAEKEEEEKTETKKTEGKKGKK